MALALTLALIALLGWGLWYLFKPMDTPARLAEVDQLEQEVLRDRAETLAIIDRLESEGCYTHEQAVRRRQETYHVSMDAFEAFRALREVYWQCE